MQKQLKTYLFESRFTIFFALITSLVHFLLVKNRDLVTFTFPEEPRLHIWGILALAAFVCFFFYLIIFSSIKLLIQKNKVFLSYFKYFCIYGCIMGVFWLMTWPGIFKGDEFYVIKSALHFALSPAQSGITSVFYIVSLLIFPSMATITFFQLFIICCIFAYIMREIRQLLPGQSSWLFMFVFLLPPVVDGNLFTLRPTLVGWGFLLLICKLLFAYYKGRFTAFDFVFMAVLSGLLCAWRSETAYLIMILPAALWFLKLLNPVKAVVMVLVIALSFGCWNLPNKIALNGSNKYPISLVLNPIANLFTHVEELKGPDVYEDVFTINELVDAQLLRQSASVRNISQYWNIPDVLPKEQLNRFMKSSLRLIVYNPKLFLKYRILTFAHTNGLYPNEINHPGGESVDAINKLVYYDMDYKSMFVWMNPPLGQTLREKCISLLACRRYEQGNIQTNWMLPVFYNVIPTIILLCFSMLCSIFSKRKEIFVLGVLTLLQVVLIFLTAPAMFFMYYYCFFLCGYFIVCLHFCIWLNARTNSLR